eukprot:5888478-Prymnesium_polylepis.1
MARKEEWRALSPLPSATHRAIVTASISKHSHSRARRGLYTTSASYYYQYSPRGAECVAHKQMQASSD